MTIHHLPRAVARGLVRPVSEGRFTAAAAAASVRQLPTTSVSGPLKRPIRNLRGGRPQEQQRTHMVAAAAATRAGTLLWTRGSGFPPIPRWADYDGASGLLACYQNSDFDNRTQHDDDDGNEEGPLVVQSQIRALMNTALASVEDDDDGG